MGNNLGLGGEENPSFVTLQSQCACFLSQRTKLSPAEATTETFQNASNVRRQGIIKQCVEISIFLSGACLLCQPLLLCVLLWDAAEKHVRNS